MAFKPLSFFTADRSLVTMMLVFAFFILFAGTILFYFFLFIGSLLFSFDINNLSDPITGNSGNNIMFVRYLQVTQQLSFFLFPSVMMVKFYRSSDSQIIFSEKKIRGFDIILVFVLAFFAVSVTTWTGIINSKLTLPDSLSGIEVWIREKEEKASAITNVLVESSDIQTYLMNLFILGIVPAVSEEMIFRGVMQQLFYRIFRTVHWPVWITAIIFSTIHLQFYGFFPRLILGLIFGYLFLWSRNIILPVAAHFFNNAIAISFTYFTGQGNLPGKSFEVSGEGIPAIPFLQIIGGIIILFYFRSKYQNKNNENNR